MDRTLEKWRLLMITDRKKIERNKKYVETMDGSNVGKIEIRDDRWR